MDVARIIVSVIVAALLLFTGGGKVLSLPYSAPGRLQLGLSEWFWRVTGVLELAAVLGLAWGIWFVPFGIAAAIGVCALMVGAVVFRLRAGDRAARRAVPADGVVFVIAAVAVALGVLSL